MGRQGNESVTNCHALKLRAADGKMRMTKLESKTGKSAISSEKASDYLLPSEESGDG